MTKMQIAIALLGMGFIGRTAEAGGKKQSRVLARHELPEVIKKDLNRQWMHARHYFPNYKEESPNKLDKNMISIAYTYGDEGFKVLGRLRYIPHYGRTIVENRTSKGSRTYHILDKAGNVSVPWEKMESLLRNGEESTALTLPEKRKIEQLRNEPIEMEWLTISN